jgi:hypothetical protein
MRITTLDPISLNDVTELENAPCVIEGDLKIYFESEENKLEYLNMPVHGSENSAGLNKIFDEMADDPTTGTIN